jgi:hypothetical protein
VLVHHGDADQSKTEELWKGRVRKIYGRRVSGHPYESIRGLSNRQDWTADDVRVSVDWYYTPEHLLQWLKKKKMRSKVLKSVKTNVM